MAEDEPMVIFTRTVTAHHTVLERQNRSLREPGER